MTKEQILKAKKEAKLMKIKLTNHANFESTIDYFNADHRRARHTIKAGEAFVFETYDMYLNFYKVYADIKISCEVVNVIGTAIKNLVNTAKTALNDIKTKQVIKDDIIEVTVKEDIVEEVIEEQILEPAEVDIENQLENMLNSLKNKTYAELKKLCIMLEISQTGKQKDLLKRLEEFYKNKYKELQ